MPLKLAETFQRLPVYLLIDTSGSMAGAPIAAVNEGLRMLESLLREDPQCRETAHISIIRFSSDASQLMPLTDVDSYVAPRLAADGGTALSRGLATLREAIAREMMPRSADHPGDFRPIVFLLTDGQPNEDDGWRDQARLLMEHKGRRPAYFVAIGAGPHVDMEVLKELSPASHYLLADLDPSRLQMLFQWIAMSTVVATQPAVQLGRGSGPYLAPAPANLFASRP